MTGLNTTVAVSPDGQRLVYSVRGPDGKQQLATRLLDQTQPIVLPQTQSGSDPFFSPDGQWIGFFAEGQMKEISVQGGSPVSLCAAPNPQGASWGDDGNIVVALNNLSGLSRVPSAGGTPQLLTKLANGEGSHRWPQVLPGGQAVLFTAAPTITSFDDAQIDVLFLRTGGRRTLLQKSAYFGRYLPTGHFVYLHQTALFGAAFDLRSLELRSAPSPLVEDAGQFDFSASSGTLIYLAGRQTLTWPLVWLDDSGKIKPLLTTPGKYGIPRFSPDGQQLSLITSGNMAVYNLPRETLTRLTFSRPAGVPAWAPDGKHIAYRSKADAGFGVYWIRADGAGEEQQLLKSSSNVVPWSFSPDGRLLAYNEVNADTGRFDLWLLPLDLADPEHPKPGKPQLLLRTNANENMAAFSPDGRFLAYRSDESGNNEIYVRPFPGLKGKWLVSNGGALYMFWSSDGRELFYETVDNRIMVVDYTINGDSFSPGKPRPWSDTQLFNPGVLNLALHPDGKRFAVFPMPESSGERGSVHVTFLLNFFDELRRRIPPK